MVEGVEHDLSVCHGQMGHRAAVSVPVQRGAHRLKSVLKSVISCYGPLHSSPEIKVIQIPIGLVSRENKARQ